MVEGQTLDQGAAVPVPGGHLGRGVLEVHLPRRTVVGDASAPQPGSFGGSSTRHQRIDSEQKGAPPPPPP